MSDEVVTIGADASGVVSEVGKAEKSLTNLERAMAAASKAGAAAGGGVSKAVAAVTKVRAVSASAAAPIAKMATATAHLAERVKAAGTAIGSKLTAPVRAAAAVAGAFRASFLKAAGGVDKAREASTKMSAVQAKVLAGLQRVSDGVTKMSGIYGRMQAAGKIATTALQNGISKLGTTVQGKAVGAFKQLRESIKSATDAMNRNRNAGSATHSGMMRMVAGGQLLAYAVRGAARAVFGFLEGAAAKSKGMKTAAKAVKGLEDSVTKGLMPTFNKMGNAVTPVINKLKGPLTSVAKTVGGQLLSAFRSVAPALPGIVKGLGGIAKAVGGVVVGAIKTAVPMVKSFMAAFNGGGKGNALAGTFKTVGGAVVGLLGALKPLMPLLGSLARSGFQMLGTAAKMALGFVKPMIGPIVTMLKAVATTLGPVVSGFQSFIGGVLKAAQPVIIAVVNAFTRMQPAFQKIFAALGKLRAPLMTIWKGAMNGIKSVLPYIEKFAQWLGDKLPGFIDFLMPLITAFADRLAVGFGNLGAIIRMIWNNVLLPFANFMIDMTASIIDSFASLLEFMLSFPGADTLFPWAKDLIQGTKDAANGVRNLKTQLGTLNEEKPEITFADPGVDMLKGDLKEIAQLVKDIPQLAQVEVLAPNLRPTGVELAKFKASLKGVPKKQATKIASAFEFGGIKAAKVALAALTKGKYDTTIYAALKKGDPETAAKVLSDLVGKKRAAKIIADVDHVSLKKANDEIDKVANKYRKATINIVTKKGAGNAGSALNSARGNYLEGRFASGGENHVPGIHYQQRTFAEPEAQGELYVPFNPAYRARAQKLIAKGAAKLGMDLGGQKVYAPQVTVHARTDADAGEIGDEVAWRLRMLGV